MQSRPDTGDAASGAEQMQPLQAGGAEADEPGEVDVREEIGLRGADLRRRGLETPALGRDIGPASQQIRRQVRGEGERFAVRLQRGLDLQRRIRAQAEQRGELMPIELNGRLGGGNLDTRSSDLLVRLPDRDPRLEPAARPQAVQLDQSPAVGKRPPRHGEGGEIRLRLEVGLRDGGREHEPRLRSVGRGCASLAKRAFELGPMLAPEIEFIVEVERNATLIDPAPAERRRIDIVPAQALAGRAGVEIERGVQRRSRRVRERARGAYAGLGGTQARAALERPPHERVQLRIAEHRPPVLARPVAARRVLIEGERLRRERVRLALDARVTRASGERKRQYKRQDRRSRHPYESAGGRFRERYPRRFGRNSSEIAPPRAGVRVVPWNKAKSHRISPDGSPSWCRSLRSPSCSSCTWSPRKC